jgi:hypothetical protein
MPGLRKFYYDGPSIQTFGYFGYLTITDETPGTGAGIWAWSPPALGTSIFVTILNLAIVSVCVWAIVRRRASLEQEKMGRGSP